MLLVLGMQLADLRGRRPAWRLLAPALGLRLLVGPLVGLLVAGLRWFAGVGAGDVDY
jgi:predicted permease